MHRDHLIHKLYIVFSAGGHFRRDCISRRGEIVFLAEKRVGAFLQQLLSTAMSSHFISSFAAPCFLLHPPFSLSSEALIFHACISFKNCPIFLNFFLTLVIQLLECPFPAPSPPYSVVCVTKNPGGDFSVTKRATGDPPVSNDNNFEGLSGF